MEVRIKLTRPIILIALTFFLTAGFRIHDDLFEYSKNLEIFNAAYKEVGKNFVDDVKPGDLMRKGLDAMLESLDPYTVYYSETQAEEALIERQGEYSGVGCRVIIRDNYPVVSVVFPDYAFSKADIRCGDILKTISGRDMRNKTSSDVAVFLRGSANTTLNLTIEREGKLIEKTITRLQVRTKNVPYFGMIYEQTAYVKLNQFDQNAASEIQNALVNLNKTGKVKHIVLDLRDNGGGLLHEAVNIVGLFIGPGKLVVNMKGRTKESVRAWNTSAGSSFENTPLTVLVNSHSASASEVVSGSLQDLDRAVIVGRNSFGKGLVQNYFQLPYRTQMKITTAKYYTPSGRCIQLRDYRHRNSDGSASSIPDSLRKSYKTLNGRKVYDGGGIKPDLIVDEFDGQPLLKLMVDEQLLFDFVNHYRNSHEAIAPAMEFKLTKADLVNFKKEASEKLLKIIQKKLRNALYASIQDSALVNDLVKTEVFTARLQSEISSKIASFENALNYRLAHEIVSRYYGEAELYQSSFSGDPDIKAALGIWNDASSYKRILNP